MGNQPVKENSDAVSAMSLTAWLSSQIKPWTIPLS